MKNIYNRKQITYWLFFIYVCFLLFSNATKQWFQKMRRGKHNPPAWRHKTVAAARGEGVIQDDVLPVVIIKDPINWIHSMCKHRYGARWRHTDEHCPNLIPNGKDKGRYKDGVVRITLTFLSY